MINKPGQQGKWAEKQVQTWLESRSATSFSFGWHRFPDARAARGALAAQPSDMLVVHTGVVMFLEIKESKETKRLPKAKVSQYGALLKFHLAGAKVAVLIFRSSLVDWVYITNEHLFEHEECPPSFPFEGRPSFPSAAAALQEIFK